MSTMIQVHGISKTYGQQSVLAGVDLTVNQGTVIALLGPNGAGKTTLVRILSTLTRPDAGTATIAGHDVVREARQVRAAISLTGQYAAVDEYLTGAENLRLISRLWKRNGRQDRQRQAELLERFDLAEARNRPVKTYSGGMRRKLDLALSLLAEPRVLFLDEPTTGLDPRSRLAMWDIVRELAITGVTVFLTTQYLEEADQLADTIAMIDHGNVIARGTPEHLKREISGNRAELQFGNEAMFQKAAWILGIRAIAPASPRLTLTVDTGTGTAEIRDLLNELDAAGVRIERMSILEPTLDDVFLKLTGQPVPIAEAA